MPSSERMSAPATFGERLRAAMDEHGPLCVGIDPHRALVESWGLPYDLAGVERFALTCVEAFGQAAVVKPQSAFFEVFGSRGLALLERVLDGLRGAGTLSILDAKRGDIGSTMAAYAEGLIGSQAQAPADAVTVSPYLGYGSLRPVIDLAHATGRGVFVLGLTSNPEGASVQHARDASGRSVAGGIVAGVGQDNAAAAAAGRLGSIGLVVGATIGGAVQELGIDLAAADAPMLAPGIGAQGATPADLARVFGAARGNVLASSSREVLGAGPDVAALRRAVGRTASSVRAALQ